MVDILLTTFWIRNIHWFKFNSSFFLRMQLKWARIISVADVFIELYFYGRSQYRFTFTSDRCLIDIDPSVLAVLVVKQLGHQCLQYHDDVIKWKHFPRCWPFVRGIHWSPVNSPHKGQSRRALMVSLICTWINNWVNNRDAGDLRHHRGKTRRIGKLCPPVPDMVEINISRSTSYQQNDDFS